LEAAPSTGNTAGESNSSSAGSSMGFGLAGAMGAMVLMLSVVLAVRRKVEQPHAMDAAAAAALPCVEARTERTDTAAPMAPPPTFVAMVADASEEPSEMVITPFSNTDAGAAGPHDYAEVPPLPTAANQQFKLTEDGSSFRIASVVRGNPAYRDSHFLDASGVDTASAM
jgi:hypothetical protein